MENTLISLVGNYGPLALFAVLYYILFRWVLKHFEKEKDEYQKILNDSAEREINYQAIISKLSDELPNMRETLVRIESNQNRGLHDGRNAKD